MGEKKLSHSTVHRVPVDLGTALRSRAVARTAWNSLTPLARNEWICWVISVKKEDTRKDHIARLVREVAEGKRRPCCWIGCIHRKDKEVSPSVQGILKRRSRS